MSVVLESMSVAERQRDSQGRFVRGAGARVTWDDALSPRLRVANERLDLGVKAAVEYHATIAEAHMRTNAPWTDRTTNARNGLMATAVHSPFRHAIVLYHSVPYGIWLEIRNQGRYAIIMPTVHEQGQALMTTLRDLLRSMVR